MEIHKLLYNIINNPLSLKHYRDLEEYYKNHDKLNEAEAIRILIAKRFSDVDNNSQLQSKS